MFHLRVVFVALFTKYTEFENLREIKEKRLVNYNSAYYVNFQFLYVSLTHKIIQTVCFSAISALNTSIRSKIGSVGIYVFVQTLTC